MTIWLVTVILVMAMLLLISEKLPVDLTSIGIMVVLTISGILAPTEAIAGFANPAVITVGAMFLITVMALAGVGVGYSAWIDTITIEGSVTTGSVDWELIWVSGTWVYKVPAADNEIVIQHVGGLDPGVRPTVPDGNIPRVLPDGTVEPTIAYGEVYDYDAETETLYIEWDNLFPGPFFCVDFLWHYVGSIPVKIDSIDFVPD